MSEYLADPCPACGEKQLRIEWRLEATDGLLSGSTLKVPAREWPWLVCDHCKAEARGERE